MSILRNHASPARMLVSFAVLALSACQAPTSIPASAPIVAPRLVVGDHWQYTITDNLRRGVVTLLDVEVTSIADGTATLRKIYAGPNGRDEVVEEVDANSWLVVGALKQERVRRFPTPLKLYDFPLEQGKTWRQAVNTTNPESQLPSQILVFARVQGMRPVSGPAGSFDAAYIYRILQLDDEQFWRSRTERRDSVWYDAAVKAPVRELRDALFIEYSGPESTVIRTENTTRELTSYQPGKG